MIDGIGVDIIEIDRIEKAVAKQRFKDRIYTPAEQEYCDAAHNAERYAGRFAAKEAVIKALGRACTWKNIEILRLPSGKPVAHLHGDAAELLAGRRVHVTISHCQSYAVANAVVESIPEAETGR
jgi:holo-[acyl-carrier protein] synthase